MNAGRLPWTSLGVTALLGIAGCQSEPASVPVTQVMQAAPLQMSIFATGQLRAKASTPLLIPGEQWSQRQLIWMVEDGSPVHAGDVVARFGAPASELELSKALLDLQRNALARGGAEDKLRAAKGRVDVDLADVDTSLGIVRRYQGVDLDMFARNDILDALQDESFLTGKQAVLSWQRARATERGAAEQAVYASQRASFDLQAQQKRKDLDALELRAPNDGILVLSTDWSDQKPQLGGVQWAGQEFATLPDASQLELELSVPASEAQGATEGATVQFYPRGHPEQVAEGTLTWVASGAKAMQRRNPIKFLQMRVSVPQEAAVTHAWVPGQSFDARISVADKPAALSLPNTALRLTESGAEVQVWEDGEAHRRRVELGARSAARSEVTAGLAEGDVVLLMASTDADGEAATGDGAP